MWYARLEYTVTVLWVAQSIIRQGLPTKLCKVQVSNQKITVIPSNSESWLFSWRHKLVAVYVDSEMLSFSQEEVDNLHQGNQLLKEHWLSSFYMSKIGNESLLSRFLQWHLKPQELHIGQFYLGFCYGYSMYLLSLDRSV